MNFGRITIIIIIIIFKYDVSILYKHNIGVFFFFL